METHRTLDHISDALDTGAKFVRVISKEGVTTPQFRIPIDDPRARRNLAAFFAAGCPALPAELLAPIPAPIISQNEHGHTTITFVGRDRSGAEEIALLEENGNRVSDWAKSCFTSTRSDGYDAQHRLVAGQHYTIALVPGREIARDSGRTTSGLQAHAAGRYGYEKPLAGIVPRIREAISDQMMEELGFWYIAALHTPIQDSDGDPGVLGAFRHDGGRWVCAFWGGPGRRWVTEGAFAFLVPGK